MTTETDTLFQKQIEAQKKICCWKDPNVDLVEKWLQTVIEFSRSCFKYEEAVTDERCLRERHEYHEWIKEYTQHNCLIHSKEGEE